MNLRHFRVILVPCVTLVCALFAFVVLMSLQPRTASAETPAFVRIVHASPNIGTADIFLDGTTLLRNFQFGTVTNYAAIPPGPHKVQIALLGKGIGASVITQMLTVNPGIVYTVAALGAKSNELSLKVFIDNNQLASGIAKVRVYHLSPGIGSVNVSNGSNALISNLGYPEASDYLTLAAGAYTFNITTAQSNMALSPISATLKANTVTSLFAVGLATGTPKIQFVTAQVQGVPGMPQTGSDPNAVAVDSQPLTLWPWLFGMLFLVVIGATIVIRHQKANM